MSNLTKAKLSPIIPIGSMAGGLLLIVYGKTKFQKTLGVVLTGVGAVGVLSSFTKKTEKVRLIFYGGARETNNDGSSNKVGIAHNSAFEFASKNVAKDYSDFSTYGSKTKITTGKALVEKINNQAESSIHTLDIISHGTAFSLNFSLKKNENCGIYTTWWAKKGIEAKYTFSDGEFYTFTDEARRLDDIDYKKFSDDARIELHGCETADDYGLPLDSFVKTMSLLLYEANKKHGVVIGHLTKANPNINGSTTTYDEQDYRHGKRTIFHNGEELFNTSVEGAINYSEIHKHLKIKLGDDY